MIVKDWLVFVVKLEVLKKKKEEMVVYICEKY